MYGLHIFVSTAFSNVFHLSSRPFVGIFVTVQLLKKYGKTCLTPAPLYLLDPFGTPTWTWESSIVRRERHPCNLTDYMCHGISQLQLLKGHDCNKSCTSICGAGNDFLFYARSTFRRSFSQGTWKLHQKNIPSTRNGCIGFIAVLAL